MVQYVVFLVIIILPTLRRTNGAAAPFGVAAG
jgi:hypothetical protein